MIPQSHIRNFSIIAHIDHGKTTLTDRMLVATDSISEREFHDRLLDSNPIEMERGITIKMAPVRMEYVADTEERYELNLIDTPGHVDFSYEVSRSLAAVEGVVLLVDATKGVQAQTLSHFDKTKAHDLVVIPVLNKVDLPNAEVEDVQLQMMELFGFELEEFVLVSAKTGMGVDHLFETIVERVPPPQGDVKAPLKALVFNSFFHEHKGVMAAVRIVDGVLHEKRSLQLLATETVFNAPDWGVFVPSLKQQTMLRAGEVGYLSTGLKDIQRVRVGDTLTYATEAMNVAPLEGYTAPQLMVYMDFYPTEGDDFAQLLDGMDKLQLHDAALQYTKVYSPALGNGLRVGFLGILHAEIVQERLEREFDVGLIATYPSVKYELRLTNGEAMELTNPSEMPDPSEIGEIREPVAAVKLYAPKTYVGAMMQLVTERRGSMKDMHYIADRVVMDCKIPLSEIIVTFFDELKSLTSGYASLEYEVESYQVVKAVKLSVLINDEPVEALSQIAVSEQAQQIGRRVVSVLSDEIPRQLFEIKIQAAIGGTIVARDTVNAFRKDVTAKLYGGDITRRKKLLEKQKKGKKRRAVFGKVEIPQKAFMAVLKRRE